MLQSALPETDMSSVPPSAVKVMVDAQTVNCGSGLFAFLQDNKDITAIRNINILKGYLIFIFFLNFLISYKSPQRYVAVGI